MATPAPSTLPPPASDRLLDAIERLAAQVGRLADAQASPGPAPASDGPARPAARALEVPEADRPLFEALREWRRAEARKAGVAPYVVAHDAKLLAVAAARPTDPASLAAVFGHRRTERYGASLLQAMATA